ncbi:MAG: LacI family DNA-binding transcriptional regulator [Armatimonadota bacterium]|nr:LacI family DNA-binding transcriptional regulator [Armatimonadota bacterium]MDR7436705.1 LacI family DNA-binding transcriptional regulator [Armatimonadota bacterium]MDR7471223.1 LacI family DNA-binding transcriptional regulator [Armatimonadota bacterium]MDR7507359.1 LacI family DNA-binding transcriptional regulator [Armatimonadota bacterium]MDR7515960.1 LacI family DNA-binding transcriptional regulator [Armatimonadota bacterium]
MARRARVSVTTAARALGGYGYVSSETRRRVQEAAAALDYHPNAIARSMIKGRTHTLAVVVSDNANPFFASVVRGIEDTVLPQHYTVMLCNADEDPRKEATYLHVIREKRVDGVILSPSGGPRALLRSLLSRGTPVVLVDRRVRGVRTDTVLVDNRAGARAAVGHLLRLGHRRIGIISGPRHIFTARERLAGYVEALREAGVTVDHRLVLEGNFKADSGYTLAEQMVNLPHRPTAVFTANNLMTLGALLRFKELGVRIPQEMAVVGFDDMPWAPILTPPLTAVAQPSYDLGVAAARLLLQRLRETRTPPQTVVFQPRLIVRESCGAGRFAAEFHRR